MKHTSSCRVWHTFLLKSRNVSIIYHGIANNMSDRRTLPRVILIQRRLTWPLMLNARDCQSFTKSVRCAKVVCLSAFLVFGKYRCNWKFIEVVVGAPGVLKAWDIEDITYKNWIWSLKLDILKRMRRQLRISGSPTHNLLPSGKRRLKPRIGAYKSRPVKVEVNSNLEKRFVEPEYNQSLLWKLHSRIKYWKPLYDSPEVGNDVVRYWTRRRENVEQCEKTLQIDCKSLQS